MSGGDRQAAEALYFTAATWADAAAYSLQVRSLVTVCGREE
jgi:hypothetical protein